jgi:GT2 family glycosyltransferase
LVLFFKKEHLPYCFATVVKSSWRLEPPNPHLRRTPNDTTRVEYERQQAETAWKYARETPEAARPWLERAYRFASSDQNLAFALATARLVGGDAAGALALYTLIASRHAVRDVYAGQAAAALLASQPEQAEAAIRRALSGFTLSAATRALAERIAGITGQSWCGLSDDGVFACSEAVVQNATLDHQRIALHAGKRLPPRWRQASMLSVVPGIRGGYAPPLGSPIDLRAMRRIEGVAWRVPGGVAGWAWHPGAPEIDPVLTIECNGMQTLLTAADRSVTVTGAAPLTMARGFYVAAAARQSVRVLAQDGRDLLGSPLPARRAPGRAPAPVAAISVTVIVPIYRGRDATIDCIDSVLATLGPRDRVIVVNDASPEPDLVAALARRAASSPQLRLIASCAANPARNLGFPAAANAGLRAAAGTDVVLLNSDTVVFPGWLETLRRAAHARRDIGTATPLSNDATIFTYPDPAAPAPMPSRETAAHIAAQTAIANAGVIVDVPTGHGFCLYIRAACLHATGLLREDVFAQGYGEENDFCERARAKGWRHVAVPAVYVAHRGGESFGPARAHLLQRNAALLDALHPRYHLRVAAYIEADGLAASRRRLDAALWREAHADGTSAVLLITHSGAGGTRRVVTERAEAARKAGLTPVILSADEGVVCVDADTGTPNLRFDLPDEFEDLATLLAAARPREAELHHLLGHDTSITDLLTRFALPTKLWVHDWSWICPRLAFVTPEARYCGEADAAQCVACVQRGDPPAIPLSAAALRARSDTLLRDAVQVIAATQDGARRIARHFPGVAVSVTPWESPPPPKSGQPHSNAAKRTIAVVGALGTEKGYEVLLACARDAAERQLNLKFAVVGFTIDDTPLLETGRVTVTGPFVAGEAAGLIHASGATHGFLPSIWPETWCYALSDLWSGGLDACVFDIGAPAERVRQTGRGVVIPLGLSPGGVNDALLRLPDLAGRSC